MPDLVNRFYITVRNQLPTLPADSMRLWCANPDLLNDRLREALRSFPGGNSVLYPIEVNFRLSVATLVESGEFWFAHPTITARHFPSKDRDTVREQVRLIGFDAPFFYEGVIAFLDKRGLRPVVLKELLVLGAMYKNIQVANPVVGLGSTWYDNGEGGIPKIACLFGGVNRRIITTMSRNGMWAEDWRVAAVPK